ncbi:prepilin peptidase dependent protein B [Klebsiella pneumoniae]|uniref:Prepilin peptidase dependent protein B n=1 Tax=Klebsiella pneumoniae TaxID=573 RepID=A0A3S4KD27_KLEPN|nr:prepilin peptidase dependent protein B [Klebsiella pneumoniae]
MSRRGFSLAEALIAMAIGSLLLMGACRFLPALQRHILRQGEQLALENELWQRVHAVGKHLQRAGYCRGACGGAGLELAAGGECLIVRWDANSNGRWETSPAAAAESTGFRLRDGALETLRGASDCRGGGWEKITNPAAIGGDALLGTTSGHPGLRAGAERDAGGALRATDGPDERG